MVQLFPTGMDRADHTPEMRDGCLHDFNSGFLLADLSIHEDKIRRRLEVLRLADRAGGSHDAPERHRTNDGGLTELVANSFL
jgi:hypothetical protein